MKNIYIHFSDNLITDKLFSYLKSYFTSILIFNENIELSQENILITDVAFFITKITRLKNTNVILLCTQEELNQISQDNLQNVTHLNIPIKIDDLISLLEQKNFAIANIYKYKEWVLDVNGSILYKDTTTLNLSEKETLILKEFFSNPNSILSKEYFLKYVWNIHNKEIISQSLESYISVLRKKFHDYNIDLSIIKEKEGYLLN